MRAKLLACFNRNPWGWVSITPWVLMLVLPKDAPFVWVLLGVTALLGLARAMTWCAESSFVTVANWSFPWALRAQTMRLSLASDLLTYELATRLRARQGSTKAPLYYESIAKNAVHEARAAQEYVGWVSWLVRDRAEAAMIAHHLAEAVHTARRHDVSPQETRIYCYRSQTSCGVLFDALDRVDRYCAAAGISLLQLGSPKIGITRQRFERYVRDQRANEW